MLAYSGYLIEPSAKESLRVQEAEERARSGNRAG